MVGAKPFLANHMWNVKYECYHCAFQIFIAPQQILNKGKLHTEAVRSVTLTTTPDFNTLTPRQNAHHFADDIFKCDFMNVYVWISLKISLKFVTEVPITTVLALVQIIAWRRPGDRPLSEPMMVSLLKHICGTRRSHTDGFIMVVHCHCSNRVISPIPVK